MRFLIVLAALALGATPSLADCRRAVVVKHKPVIVVEKQVVLAAVFVPLPLVSIGYAPPAPVPQAAPGPDVQALQAQVLALSQEIERLRPALGPLAQPPLPQRVASGSLLQARCAACHTETTAAAEGSGLVLFRAGKAVELIERQLEKAMAKVANGQMPPRGNARGIPDLTFAERADVIRELSGLAAKK